MPASSPVDLEADVHRVSPKPALALLMLAAIGLTFVAGNLHVIQRAAPIVSTIFGLAALCWLLDGWDSQMGRWCTILALVTTVILLDRWPGLTGTLALLAIPTAMAATLVRPWAAALVAVGESLLLFCMWISGIDSDSVSVGLVATWSMLAVIVQVYKNVNGLLAWTTEHYQQARALMEEAQSGRIQHKQLLDDLVRVNRQLAVTNDRLAAARLVAEEAEKTKASFVANVSHEFRAPLNMIIGVTDLLAEAPDVYGGRIPQALLEDLSIVRRNCMHLSSMINDVLDLSQVDAGRMALHKERVDLRSIVDGASAVVRPLVDKKGVALRVDVVGDLPEVYCDQTRIRQVIVNLLSNAARFTEAGEITVRVAAAGEFVKVSVSDTGPGIAEEDARRIFEPFSTGTGRVRQRGNGSGLGLSISKRFVELHGGQMSLETALGEGSTFTFKLPISPPLDPHAGPGRWVAEGWQWVERTSRADLPVLPPKPHCVLCDPTAELYPIFSRYFDEVEFIDVRTPQQAAQEVGRSSPQTILVNASAEACLRQEATLVMQEAADTPVIAFCLPPREEAALAAGALGYLLKPVRQHEMQAALHRVGQPIRRALVVDDEPDVQHLLTRMLRAYDGTLEVRTASSGAEALELMHVEHPDLVLLDLVMPDMDGWQLLARKREDKVIRDIPSIIVSAQDPRERPLLSRALMATTSRGLSVTHLMRCSQALSTILSQRA